MHVKFVVTKPESKRTTVSVRLPIVVGRSEEAKFRIQQDLVSRKHCEIFEQDGAVYLRDLGSTNGTFVDGALVETSARVPLETGSVVRVGGLEFRVEFAVALAVGEMPERGSASDVTVGLSQVVDPEQVRFEQGAAEPRGEIPPLITAERAAPADEPAAAVPADQSPPQAPAAAGEFGFLAAADGSADAEDGELGDFLKGLP